MNNDIDTQLIAQVNLIRQKGCNLQTVKKEIGEDRLKEFIHSVYPKFSITEIETITGIPDSTLGYWFQQLNIPFVRNHITNRAIPGGEESQIIISKGVVIKKVSTIKITPELAYIIGFALGDGNIQRFMVEVFNKDEKLRGHLFELLKPYGSITEERRENGLWRLRLSSVKIANLIKDKKEVRKDTINYIFSRDDLARRFIAAFWDAEGSVLLGKHNYYHIYLYNSDSYLLRKVCDFFDSKNIKFSLLNMKLRSNAYFLKGRPIIAKKIIQRIGIPKSSCLNWVKEIGIYLNHSKKREIVNEILNHRG